MATSVFASDESKSSLLVNKYPLVIFFLLVFGLTWPFMIVDALGSHEILPFRLPMPLMLVMGYMPTLAAVIVTGLTSGKGGIRALFGKLLIAKVGLRWYAMAIFGYAVICAGALEMANLFGKSPVPFFSRDMPQFSSPIEAVVSIAAMFVVLSLVNGEELAWRGFALPKLQATYNALTSSIILGMFWALFHLPLFFTLTGSSQVGTNFIGFLLATVCLSIIFTWMFNHTRGSVLLAYLLHGATNTWTRIFAIDHNGFPLVSGVMTGLTIAIAVILVIAFGAENLSRNLTRIQEK